MNNHSVPVSITKSEIWPLESDPTGGYTIWEPEIQTVMDDSHVVVHSLSTITKEKHSTVKVCSEVEFHSCFII